MLPTGHLAAGYLVTKFAIAKLLPIFPQAGQPRFLVVGIIAAVIVDFDDFYAFFKIGRPIAEGKGINHRKFGSHAPLLHLFIGLCAFATGWVLKNSDLQLFSILYAVGTWTHFFTDSFGYGIMWLWPFDKKLYAFNRPGVYLPIPSDLPVIQYWKKFLAVYLRDFVFLVEVTVIAFAIFIYFSA